LDCQTFEEYLGTLAPEGTRTWLYKLMRSYELYVKRLALSQEALIEIGPSKLDIIAPAILKIELKKETEPDKYDGIVILDWLDKAKTLSKIDLINEVRQYQGKQELGNPPTPEEFRQDNSPFMETSGMAGLLTYLDYVKAQPCIVCGANPTDKMHFPKTRGAGAPENWIIPCCRKCHVEYHTNPLKWMHDNQDKWAGYFYGLILKIWEK